MEKNEGDGRYGRYGSYEYGVEDIVNLLRNLLYIDAFVNWFLIKLLAFTH